MATGHILLVDDSSGDRELVRIACEKAARGVTLSVAESGEAALAMMREGPLPDLILLDLSMPGMSGFELLNALKSCDRLRNIPALVLSGSDERDSVELAYAAGAAAYLEKPDSFLGMLSLCDSLATFWLERVVLARTG